MDSITSEQRSSDVAGGRTPTGRIRLRAANGAFETRFQTAAMIDVIFILLVFFLSVSRLRSSQLDLHLPEVSTEQPLEAAPAQDDGVLLIEVTEDDRVLLEGEVLASAEELTARLKTAAARRGPGLQVQLLGDERASHGTVVKVYAALQQAAIPKVEILVTERRREGRR